MDVSTCRIIIEELLSSYVDGELDNATAQRLELHMQMCPPCAAFLRTFIAAKQSARHEVVDKMPDACEAALWSFLDRETYDGPVCGHENNGVGSDVAGGHDNVASTSEAPTRKPD